MTQLPEDLAAELMSLLRETEDGGYEITDMGRMVGFVFAHGDTYPFLNEIIKVDEAALSAHIERTGEVPPGVKMTRTTREQGSNVTHLEVVHGPGKVSAK
ncbi:hypothetical protein JH314_21400 [Xanthomonas campestris]|uniref:hypothetical protein n=1 Tax=Xanthomonas campestris TaxID=339 RepID=UPI00236899FA|nr:hypothetical protein [Xanthomonas campestris]WDJ01805.1 hypothetical protein JH314_21400 [Xanthomonas campestris]